MCRRPRKAWGLASICKQIVQAHHGSIELHSLHGGTEVRVKLPKDGTRIAGTS